MLPDSIPHVPDAGEALTDPIQFLMRARANHGNLFAIRKQGPIFSRSAECEGVVAAFGLENQRAVLTDIESFGLPVSAAENMKLPPNLVNLNRSLHSMRGAKHSNQKRLLIGMINGFEPSHRPVWEALEELTAQWTSEPVELMKRMRDLTFHASLRVLFGNGRADTRQLALLLQTYFHLRRETASVATTTSQEALEDLATVGNLLDSELREFICGCCKNTGVSSPGMFANLAAELETRLSEDEIVGHMNVFFISTTEPVAIALSWILLVLSQLPELRIELRNELDATLHVDGFPEVARLNKLVLLDGVINETLRLFSPNALMVRVTTKPVSLNGILLPARCEVILSPFISHRDETAFHRPNEFLPNRWRGAPPSPFVYFPFGAGGHSCIGRSIAMDIVKTALTFLLPRFDTFCSTASFFQRSFRLKSAERLVRELDILHARYGFSEFKLDHDMFTVNRRKVLEFCEAVNGRGYRWRASARLDCVDKELLEKMAESGCVSLYFGIETGSVRLQEICKKHLDLSLVGPMLDVAQGVGIETTASFITGYPEEQQQDQDDTLDMLGDCFRPACLPQLHMLAPEPGTAMYAQQRDRIEYDGYGGRYNALLVGSEDEQLILDQPDIFQTYYYYPAELPRSRYIFAVEAVDVFRRAGAIVLNYLLRAYEGRLSKLVGEIREFAESNNLGDRPDCAMAEEFLEWKFGSSHHLLSLYGYAVRASGGEVADFQTSSSHPLDPASPYKLNPRTYILHDYHDYDFLLHQIKRQADPTQLLDESETGERSTYLLNVSGKESTYAKIDPGVEAILSLFEQPRRCTEVADLVEQATGMPRLGVSFFRDLAQTEIIIPVAA